MLFVPDHNANTAYPVAERRLDASVAGFPSPDRVTPVTALDTLPVAFYCLKDGRKKPEGVQMPRTAEFPRASRSRVVQDSGHRAIGVVCLHCGASIPLAGPAHGACLTKRVRLVWCHICGREAPYRPEDVVDIQVRSMVNAA
jgi:hypothetical protein